MTELDKKWSSSAKNKYKWACAACVFVYICVHPGMCAYVCCECVQEPQCVCVCVHVCLCVFIQVCVCICACMLVCICYIYRCVHVCMHICVHVHAYRCVFEYGHSCLCTCVNAYRCVFAYVHACCVYGHVFVHMNVHMCLCAWIVRTGKL